MHTIQFAADESATRWRVFSRQFRIEGVEDLLDPDGGAAIFGWRVSMKTAKPEVSKIMRDNRQTKIKLILSSEMERENDNGHSSFKIHFCASKLSKILGQQMNQRYWMFSCKHLTKKFRIFNQRGSNWRYQRVISLDIHPAEYTSLNGSSCIKLPIISKGRKQY